MSNDYTRYNGVLTINQIQHTGVVAFSSFLPIIIQAGVVLMHYKGDVICRLQSLLLTVVLLPTDSKLPSTHPNYHQV